jgi:thiamine transport system ATP-binding protein
LLELDAVTFSYPKTQLIYTFDIQVSAGSVAAITGRSGCGKSTLLDLIAGFQQVNSGEILWQGRRLTDLPPSARPVTTVFQRNNLFEHRNAIDNVIVGINPKIPSRGEDVDTAVAALAAVGLEGFEKARAGQLSGGQQQRVAIARAIARKSPIVQFDEPFSALDQTTRDGMLSLVSNLANNHRCAVLMVTHSIADCEAIADKRYEMRDGALFEQ